MLVDFDGDAAKESRLGYTMTVYSNNDIEVSCRADYGDRSGTDHEYYPVTTVGGARTAGCTTVFDLPPTGSWVGLLRFEAVLGTGIVASYQDGDTDNPHYGYKYTFKDSDCNALKVSSTTNMWEDTSVSELFKQQ